ncbi:MAG: hypothetical protein M3309_04580 [Actinomycetota bacterium]|nr:hypothetical protein [Actinomycetota bacterium]
MLTLNFEGWFQCRLATDPDPSDEPRGVSGWTFAVAGEEDLDRVIRLQEPVSPRSHSPKDFGVTVQTVSVGGQQVQDHPLIGGRVELLDEPKFEGRNGIVAEDAAEFIDPFHLRIIGGGVTLRRKDILDPQDPERKIHEVDPSVMKRRQPVEGEVADRAEVAEATGAMNYVGYRQERKKKLEDDLKGTSDLVARAALRKRIADLEQRDIRVGILGSSLVYRFAIRGPAEVVGERNVLRGLLGTSPPWPIEFWMGGWDADVLCGYMRGSLRVPFRPL